MREQRYEDLGVQETPAPDGAPAPDGGGEAKQRDYVSVATNARKVRKGTYLLIAVFCVGLLCIFYMIKKSTPQKANAAAGGPQDNQIEMAISRITGVRTEMSSGMDEVVKKFYEFSDVEQVRVNELAKNPFEHEVFSEFLKQIPEDEGGIDAELLRRQQAKEMRLLIIQQTPQGNCCMIDGVFLYEGETIKGFKVATIGEGFVKLESRGAEIILKLSE